MVKFVFTSELSSIIILNKASDLLSLAMLQLWVRLAT